MLEGAADERRTRYETTRATSDNDAQQQQSSYLLSRLLKREENSQRAPLFCGWWECNVSTKKTRQCTRDTLGFSLFSCCCCLFVLNFDSHVASGPTATAGRRSAQSQSAELYTVRCAPDYLHFAASRRICYTFKIYKI